MGNLNSVIIEGRIIGDPLYYTDGSGAERVLFNLGHDESTVIPVDREITNMRPDNREELVRVLTSGRRIRVVGEVRRSTESDLYV